MILNYDVAYSLFSAVNMSKDHLQSFTWVAWLCSYLSHAHEMTKNIFLYSYSIYKHDAIDVADPNSMQDGYHELRNRPRSLESLWLSGRASECGILRSEVWFLMGTQNFFFVPSSWQDKKHLSLFLYRAQNLLSLLFCYVLLLVNVTDQLESGT